MLIECAFGLFKCRFRLFKTTLINNSTDEMGSLISASMILHNWYIDMDGLPDESEYIDHVENDIELNQNNLELERDEIESIRDVVKNYLWRVVESN